MSIPTQKGIGTPYIYTSDSGGVKVFETPAASTGQQASAPATESVASKGITVPVVQVLGEYNESGIFASVNSAGSPVVKSAAQSTSTGAQPPADSTYLYAPWSTKSVA